MLTLSETDNNAGHFARVGLDGYPLSDYHSTDTKVQAPLAFKSLATILIVEDSL